MMKNKILAILLAACMTLSFAACGDMGNGNDNTTDSSSERLQDNLNEIKENYNSMKSDIKGALDSIKEDVKDAVDDIKDDLDSSPLGKIKENVDNVKELVSDAKEIKDAIKGEARTPLKASKCDGENYEKIKKEFELAGFTNITAKGNGKLKIGLLHKEGDVETVSINGKNNFGKGDNFPVDAEIIITYYS